MIEEGYGQGEGIAYKPFFECYSSLLERKNKSHQGLGWKGTSLLIGTPKPDFFLFVRICRERGYREHYPLLEGMEEIIPELDEELIKRLINQKTESHLFLQRPF